MSALCACNLVPVGVGHTFVANPDPEDPVVQQVIDVTTEKMVERVSEGESPTVRRDRKVEPSASAFCLVTGRGGSG
jgi:hypothetical protein